MHRWVKDIQKGKEGTQIEIMGTMPVIICSFQCGGIIFAE